MDGFVLHYPVLYPGYIGVSEMYHLPGPPLALANAVRDWAASHLAGTGLTEPHELACLSWGSGENALPEWRRAHYRPPLVHCICLQVGLHSEGDAQLASLLAATEGLAHTGHPQVQRLSSNEQAAKARRLAAVQTLVINGKRVRCPQDFPIADAELFLRHSHSLHPGTLFAYAFFDEPFEQRYGLGTISQFARVDDTTIEITALTHEPLVAAPGLEGGWFYGSSLPRGSNAGRMDAQQVGELVRAFKEYAAQEVDYRQHPPAASPWRAHYPLLPPERWEGALRGELPAELSDQERAGTVERYEELRARFDAWAQTHAPQLAASCIEHVADVSPVLDFTGVPRDGRGRLDFSAAPPYCLALRAELVLDDAELRASLAAALAEGGLVHPALVSAPWPLGLGQPQAAAAGTVLSLPALPRPRSCKPSPQAPVPL